MDRLSNLQAEIIRRLHAMEGIILFKGRWQSIKTGKRFNSHSIESLKNKGLIEYFWSTVRLTAAGRIALAKIEGKGDEKA